MMGNRSTSRRRRRLRVAGALALLAAIAAAGLPGTPAPAARLEAAVPGEPPNTHVSVKFRAGGRAALLAGLLAEGRALDHTIDALAIDILEAPPGLDPGAFAAALAADPRVEWAEPVRWRRVQDTPPPSDPSYRHQKWYYDVIGAAASWAAAPPQAPVVAVLDTGVMCAHPDLAARMWRNPDANAPDVHGYDYVGTDPGVPRQRSGEARPNPCVAGGDPSAGNGIDDDRDGDADGGVFHGTFVAGVVAAAANNGVGVAGVCQVCRIMALRVANPEGWTRSDHVAAGLAYATAHGAQVANLSFGGARISAAERAAVDAAVAKGVVVVAAAGNSGQHPIAYPAALPNVIAVGASDRIRTLGRASFSNWGTGAENDRPVDMVAPGVDIVSTGVLSMDDEARSRGPSGAPIYERASGTSFSAPLVAGLAGLVLAHHPALNPSDVRELLRRTALPLAKDNVAGGAWAGAGMIQVDLAVRAAAALAAPKGPAPVPVGPIPGTQLTTMGSLFTWTNPPAAFQNQIQVTPVNNDGPSIDLIVNAVQAYQLPAPRLGVGPYLLLPGMGYTWRVRATPATTPVTESDPTWGAWSEPRPFRTPPAGSGGITALAPGPGATVPPGAVALRWADATPGVFYYEVQMSTDSQFRTGAGAVAAVWWNLVHGGQSSPHNSWATPPLQPGTRYHWRVRPRIQGDGTPAAWSAAFVVVTEAR